MRTHLLILYFLIAGFLAVGSMSKKNADVLKTSNAHFGIVSLEVLSPGDKLQSDLLTNWHTAHNYDLGYRSDTGYYRYMVFAIPTAVASIHWDNLFILFYVGLFIYFISRSRADYKANGFKIAITLILVAGFCDYLENFFMLLSLGKAAAGHYHTGLSWFVFIPSLIKWLLVFYSLGSFYWVVLRPKQAHFFKNANAWLSDFGSVLWEFRIVIIGVVALYAMLNLVPQGQDLVVMLNTENKGTILFILLALVLAMLNWYLPKTYDNARHTQHFDIKSLYDKTYQYHADRKPNIKLYIARVAGSVTLLIPAIGILSTLKTFQAYNPLQAVNPTLVLVLLVVIYLETLRNKWFNLVFIRKSTKKFAEDRYWVFFVFILALVIYSIFLSHGKIVTPSSLIWVFFSLLGLSILFLVTVNYRDQFSKSLPFVQLLIGATLATMLFFLAFNIGKVCLYLTSSIRIFSLPVVFAAIIFYTFLASYLLVLGRKHHFRYITVIVLLGIIISSGSITSYHKVATVPLKKDEHQVSLRQYISAWLKSREGEIDTQALRSKCYPVFFVNAYGGGIRAAAWTALVVGRANLLLRQDTAKLPHDFEHYVFSFSGASGGTIGFSLLAGARLYYAAHPKDDNVFSDTLNAKKVFKHDYLTADLVGIFGRDMWAGSSGTNWWRDRAAINELGWEEYACKQNIAYNRSFKFSWPAAGNMETPLLMSNTFDIDRGVKGVLAPVLLQQRDFPAATLLQELVCNDDIHISSAAFLSARFPYASPTGKFDENHHFTDGGTVENSGAETSAQLIKVFNEVKDSLAKKDAAFSCIQISILSIPNEILGIDSVARVKNLYEGVAPISGILNTLNGNAQKADNTNKYMAADSGWNYFNVQPRQVIISHGSIAPILPLGWQISDYAIELMQRSVEKQPQLCEIKQLFDDDFK